MPQQFLRSRAVHSALLLLLIFFAAVAVSPINLLVEFLNGLFIGILFTVGGLYRKLVWEAFRGMTKYTRVQQFALGCFFVWVSIAISRFASVWFRANGYVSQAPGLDYFTAFAVYTAVCAGFMQITAPGYDDAYMHGRDKFTLAIFSIVGLCIAFFVFWLQERY